MRGSEHAVPATSSSYRGLIVIGAGILALLVVVVTLVLAMDTAAHPEFEPGTPEAALGDYLADFEAGDFTAAYMRFSGSVREQWEPGAYRVAARSSRLSTDRSTRRVLVEGSDVDGDVALVRMTFETFLSNGLDSETVRDSRAIRMVREDGVWRIDEPLIWLDPGPWMLP